MILSFSFYAIRSNLYIKSYYEGYEKIENGLF